MKEKELLLMIPGPVQPDADVMLAMGSAVRAHYGPEWTKLYNLTTEMLKRVYNTKGDVFLMVGSGSCGLDACIGSAFSRGDKIIIGINGFFGERIKAIAIGYGLETILVEEEWGVPLQPAAIENAIKENPEAKGVCVVHLETSTTIINPIEEIGQIVRKYDLCYMVDAVSSLGGIDMHMDSWGIDLCASASQKCLGAPPGLALVAVGERGWNFIDGSSGNGHGWYTDLRTWRKYAEEWADWHPFPITMATNNVLALKASMDSLLLEGVKSRMERYRQLAMHLRKGLRKVGMPPYTPDEMMAPVLTAALGPAGVQTSGIVTYLVEHHQIQIAGGLGALKNKIIRIGHMAPTVTFEDIDRVLDALSQFKP